MTKEDWLENYIGAFNRSDFDAFTSYYDEDVEFDLGGKHFIKGRQGIRDFYTGVFAKVEETLEVTQVVLDDKGLACIIETEFKALEDWPDFIAGPMKKGESIFIESFIFYTIGENGKFTKIRTTRSKG
ncbi:YybH family protein [Parasphingopyxis marina]|uniref:Nuclear transport factor 2 family protein n=1 Tax=Parasphingopyxis marina TaxID=2761622 RepID=A0A842HSU3_9SPHN|nr:nuclear transport factor 2 family protein [Parasphingopyxis marina]MBC2776015.1 nuclear transport factor 2 family protein [Parasphingopyxis marina]